MSNLILVLPQKKKLKNKMKNIQIIGLGVNYPQAVYEISDDDFTILFPHNRDMAFFTVDEVLCRHIFEKEISNKLKSLNISEDEFWNRLLKKRIDKRTIQGIHGTLIDDQIVIPSYFPNRKETDWGNN